jgi:hypothetical protein
MKFFKLYMYHRDGTCYEQWEEKGKLKIFLKILAGGTHEKIS